METITFILNDETQTNSYGFRVATDGISLERFVKNPVCLNNHQNDTKSVLGRWVNIQKQGSQLIASPEFDTEDTEGKEVVRKVQKGILKACSMGISFALNDVELVGGVPVVQKCTLLEVSIVAIPSNAGAVTLYNDKGEILSEEEIKNLCLSFEKNNSKNHIPMNKKIISLLKLEENASQEAITKAVEETIANLLEVTTERNALKEEINALKVAENQRINAEFSAELERAIKDGRIDADATEPIKELQKASHLQAMKLLAGLKPYQSVAGQVKNEKTDQWAKLSWDELDKQNLLAELKASDPTLFAEKFKTKFGKELAN